MSSFSVSNSTITFYGVFTVKQLREILNSFDTQYDGYTVLNKLISPEVERKIAMQPILSKIQELLVSKKVTEDQVNAAIKNLDTLSLSSIADIVLYLETGVLNL
jgi:hypothetical protein